jgi:hypothetical protein
MNANPFLGVFFHWLGGLAAGSFYVPYRGVRRWSWETYWLVGGFFSWIIAPWVVGHLMTNDLLAVLHEAPWGSMIWPYFWGVMWGLGGLTFGLTMRYLGMSLGMAVALGYCAAFGTLAPPIYKGEFAEKMLHAYSGWVILAGVAVCLAGIAVTGLAGMSKENDMPEDQKKAAIKEFNFKKGLLVATFSGVLSASFSYGLDRGEIIKRITLRQALSSAASADGLRIQTSMGEPASRAALKRIKNPDLDKTIKEIDDSLKTIKDSDPALTKSLKDYKQVIVGIAGAGGDPKKYLDKYGLWQGLPVLVVVLLGGFTTNFLWCLLLNVKNKTGHQYFSPTVRDRSPGRRDETIIETAIDAPSEEVVEHMPRAKREPPTVPLLSNYFFCALAGTTWYMQFFFYSMGETQMGDYKFSSWTLHMASIIIFSTLWGIALREWKGSSRRTIALVTIGLAVLVGSTIIVGCGNYLAAQAAGR